MTNGSAPPADDPASTSTKEPTDGLPTAYKVSEETLSRELLRAFTTGFELGKLTPNSQCPKIRFQVSCIREDGRVLDIEAVID